MTEWNPSKSAHIASFRDDVVNTAGAETPFKLETAPGDELSSQLLSFGTITDSISGAFCYTVSLNDGPTVTCGDLSQGGMHPLGPRPIHVYEVGTPVLVYWSPENMQGTVIGAFPSTILEKEAAVPGYIIPFTGTGLHNDACHYHRFSKDNEHGLRNYNTNRPADTIPNSDQGYVNELGVGYGMSRLFSWVRGSELSSIYCFYPDNLIRVVAYNYERWTAAGEYWLKNDQTEINEVEMFTPYPWEGMGMGSFGAAATEELASGGKFGKGQLDTWHKPSSDEQFQIMRHLSLRGYLGDIHKEMVVVPEEGKVGDPETISNKSNYTGVLDIQKHINGHYAVRSAKGITLEKYIFLPVPKQISRPEGESQFIGDNELTYKFSSIDGAGAPHIKSEYTHAIAPQAPTASLAWVLDTFDYHAYMFNWYGVRGLYERRGDWHFPDERVEYPGLSPLVGAVNSLGDLSTLSFLSSLPAVATMKIDHRQPVATYYQSRAAIDLLEDGSILLQDGYGSTIHMTGGSIFISCAGDVWNLPGRSSQTWAGDDICVRAGSSVDVSAAMGDVRIKAENNLHALAGNSRIRGGLLLECRTFSAPFNFIGVQGEDVIHNGVTIKSEFAPLLTYSSEVYMRSMYFGNITLDADKGFGGILQIGRDHTRWGLGFFADICGSTPFLNQFPTVLDSSVHLFTREIHLVGGNAAMHCASPLVTFSSTRSDVTLMTDGPIIGNSLLIEQGAILGNALLVAGAVISTSALFGGASVPGVPGTVLAPAITAPTPIPFPPLLIPPIKVLVEATAAAYDALKTTTLAITSLTWATYYAPQPTAWGNDALVIFPIQFSMRSHLQYSLFYTDFHLPEMLWQRMLRKSSPLGAAGSALGDVAGPMGALAEATSALAAPMAALGDAASALGDAAAAATGAAGAAAAAAGAVAGAAASAAGAVSSAASAASGLAGAAASAAGAVSNAAAAVASAPAAIAGAAASAVSSAVGAVAGPATAAASAIGGVASAAGGLAGAAGSAGGAVSGAAGVASSASSAASAATSAAGAASSAASAATSAAGAASAGIAAATGAANSAVSAATGVASAATGAASAAIGAANAAVGAVTGLAAGVTGAASAAAAAATGAVDAVSDALSAVAAPAAAAAQAAEAVQNIVNTVQGINNIASALAGFGRPMFEPPVLCTVSPEVTTYPSPGLTNWIINPAGYVMNPVDTMWSWSLKSNIPRNPSYDSTGPLPKPILTLPLVAGWSITKQKLV